MMVTPDPLAAAREAAQTAIFLKGHLKLMSLGMKNTSFTTREIFIKAYAITGTAYKRGQYDRAVDDLQSLIDYFATPNGAKKVRT